MQRFTKSSKRRVHERLVFHWIGSHLENDSSLDAEAKSNRYVECLRNSLSPDQGLWLNPPRVNDVLGKNEQFKVTLPICCFTETSLDEIHEHSSRYGRMGLGFPKKFVLDNGGRPVNYIKDHSSDPTLKSWEKLQEILEQPKIREAMTTHEEEEFDVHFKFVTHFLKRIQQPRSPTTRRATGRKKKVAKPKASKLPKRAFGAPLHYLEEREWRIVCQQDSKPKRPKRAVVNSHAEMDGGPACFLPYTPGKDLFTVVFPDTHTMAKAMSDPEVHKALLSPGGPHISLLTIDDIGTF